MKKRIAAALLAGIIAAGMISTYTPADEIEWEEDPAEVTWMLWNVGGTVNEEGIQRVEDALNEITLPKINVEVDLQVIDMGTYLSQMPMQVSAGDKIDLVTTFPAGAGSFTAMRNAGQLMPLQDLLEENAPELLDLIPEKVLQATTVDGELYAVPVYTDYTNDFAWICKEQYLTEAGFSKDDIHNMDDITKVFEKVHELHPEMKMISSSAQDLGVCAGAMLTGISYDHLGTDLLAVMVDKDATKVVSYYETEEYKELSEKLHAWYEAGYIDQDVSTRTSNTVSDPTVFSFLLGGNDERTHGSERMAGESLVSVKLLNGYVTTGTVAIMDMAIPTSAREPEGAARLMNLCYTDKELKMLVSYGLEGENYHYAENGGLVENENSSYSPNTIGIFGNAFLCDLKESSIEDEYDPSKVDIENLKYSPLLGFNVNTDNISAEAAALSAVYNEYKGMVCTGVADEDTYQAFIDKLYSNGLQKYIDDVQSQLDAWLAQ